MINFFPKMLVLIMNSLLKIPGHQLKHEVRNSIPDNLSVSRDLRIISLNFI